MINDHAIMLTRENVSEIRYWTHASQEAMEELLKDAAEEQTDYYIVFTRDPKTGVPSWYSFTSEGLLKYYTVRGIRSDWIRVDKK